MNPAIGRLVLTPMDVKTVDVEGVFRDFRECLNTFDTWAASFWSFSALDVEQVFKVGDEVALVAPTTRSLYPSSTVATCRADGTLTLVHMFQSTRFVPIGNTPVVLQRVDPNGGPLGEPIHKTIGASGILEITECDRNQQYQITFYPNVSKDHVKALYASYQSVIAELEARLREEWAGAFQAQWQGYTDASPLDRRRLLETAFLSGIGKALYSLWDNITQLYDLLANLKANGEKLLQYITQAELDELLRLGNDTLA
ncbi:MAG: type IV secretion protein Rhs, partial [Pseudomonas sp.]|nr:type IV secretion protein Rhs [Pseudomonas sp.]